ncbi:MAG: beta-N-acetylglucosaminidase, partial [Acidobacteriota bacterium]|nr:beta-N-acetylglucosaminidase [Acidobacteriota bacterium]
MPGAGRKKSARFAGHRLSAAGHSWVERTLAKLTLREKIGQMLMVPFFGGFQAAGSDEYKSTIRQVDDNYVGGFILDTLRGPMGIRRSQLYPTAVMINDLQRRSKIPLLIGADVEFGTRMRIEEGTPIPAPMAIAATGDPTLAFEAAKITAIESREAGVHWVFAPVADVNSNPDNPIINFRSFGGDARDTARYVSQYICGVETHGALATAKHFPGHGNVNVDSHLALPVVEASCEELETNELLPFRAAIAAGVSAVMPGHLSVPALESDANIPATLSRQIVTELLRKKMNFEGLIVTDAMEMGAITALFSPGEAAVRAAEAGADVILMPPVPDAALASIGDAVRSGRISLARIDASVRRILKVKARLRLNTDRFIEIERLKERFGNPEFEQKAQEIADRGVTLLRDRQMMLPLDSTRPLRVLLVALAGDRDPCPAETLAPEIQPRVDSLSVLRADTQFSPVGRLKLPPPESYDAAIAALFVRVADRKGHVGFPADQRAFVNQLIAVGKPTAVAAFGSPYLVEQFPNAKTWMAVFSTHSVAQRAAARALFGQTAIGGKIPVDIPGAVARGAGLSRAAIPMALRPASRAICERLRPAYGVLDRGASAQAFPGGVLAVGWKNDLAIRPFGALTYVSKSARVTPETIFDVASLTKVIVTT